MSNPTTYYGWQMPEPTSLVTDLPADFEVFGQAVDTDFQDLLGGTTGQVLSKTSATDLDFTWVDATAGDITGVTAGTGISGGGTSGTVTVTNSMATAIDAKGDLVAGTGADAFSRLAVGTNGQVLTANSAAATGLEYTTISAGGMTLLSTTTFNNTVTTYTLSSIPQTYKHLLLIGNGLQSDTAGTDTTFFRLNGDTGANYGMGTIANNGGSASVAGDPGNTKLFTPSTTNMGATGDATSRFGNFTLNIYDYTATSYKAITYFAGSCNQGSGFMASSRGLWDNTAAITSITFASNLTNNLKAGTVRLYGVA